MISCKPVFLPFLTWVIQNEKKALFWEDSCYGFPPLSNMDTLNQTKSILKEKWDANVSDYFYIKVDNGLKSSHWKNLSSIPIPTNQRNILQTELKKRFLHYNDTMDCLIWSPSPSGMYSIKQGYNLIENPRGATKRRCYSLCWSDVGLPKAK
ncbi:hypothetical protein SUGI_1002430 [Cryptomeria japonica]|nr:hypothetical protein SUGI_1002430 [Cryptomeria japonica]